MSWFVYILRCADDTLYTGITTDCARRVVQHNSGKGAKYTRNRTPVTLIYNETSDSRSSASVREYQIKRLTRKQKLTLIAEQKKG
mgnify:CR=1 FL=1